MRSEISIESSVTSSDGKIRINRKNATALASALKAAQQLYAAGALESEYRPAIQSMAGILNAAVEDAITKALGGGRIAAGSGGFYPDYVIVEDGELSYRELKLVTTKESINKAGDTQFSREGRVKLAGGGGITLRSGIQEITTGFTTTTQQTAGGAYKYSTTAETTLLKTTRFIDLLLAVKDSPDKILRLLEGRTSIARALKSTLIAKANSIEIPINHGGVLKLVAIKFDWNNIKKCVMSKKMRISIKAAEATAKEPSGITIQVYFNQSVINDGLKSANLAILKIIDGPSGNFIKEALAKISALPSKSSIKQIKLFLKELNFDAAARYIPGSVIVSRGTVKYKNPPKQSDTVSAPKPQKFISSAQWTFLVQKRLGDSMLSFGDPEPPDIKERSGRFRRSVDVTANYRTKTIQYSYNPLYRSLQHYGYRPELQVERSIRQVAQDLYAREFSIIRRGGLA